MSISEISLAYSHTELVVINFGTTPEKKLNIK